MDAINRYPTLEDMKGVLEICRKDYNEPNYPGFWDIIPAANYLRERRNEPPTNEIPEADKTIYETHWNTLTEEEAEELLSFVAIDISEYWAQLVESGDYTVIENGE